MDKEKKGRNRRHGYKDAEERREVGVGIESESNKERDKGIETLDKVGGQTQNNDTYTMIGGIEDDSNIGGSNESAAKEKKENSKEDAQSGEGDNENIQKDVSNEINIIANSWRDLVPNNILDFVLTKEDFELVRSVEIMLLANINRNILTELRNRSNDRCEIDRLLQFIIIRKIGTILEDSYKTRLDALKHALGEQVKIMQAYIQALGQAAMSLANSFIMNVGQVPNFATNAKTAAIIATIATGIGATGTSIGQIKTQITNLIRMNEFCVRACTQGCGDTIPLTALKLNNMREYDEDYNEGIEFARTNEYVLRELERLISAEVEYAITEMEKRKKVKLKKIKSDI